MSARNDNAKAALDVFGKYVIQQARSNLSKKGKNSSNKLYSSLKYDVKVSKNSFQFAIEAEDYASFQDLGVKGKFKSAKAPNSPFKFGSGTGRKGGLSEGILGWVTQKRFQFQDRSTGKFLSFKATSFLIVRSIFNTGLKPSLFLTKPFEDGFKRLPDDIVEAYGLDVETFLKQIIKNGKKN